MENSTSKNAIECLVLMEPENLKNKWHKESIISNLHTTEWIESTVGRLAGTFQDMAYASCLLNIREGECVGRTSAVQ